MRLIDADKIDFGKVFIGASDFAKDAREEAQKLIDEQPTAYNADKVVEQLESVSIPENKVLYASPDEFGQFVKLKDAVEIVKSGGIE